MVESSTQKKVPTKGEKIAQVALANAESSSLGKCAKYALGMTVQEVGIESAKDYGSWLISVGYKESSSKHTDVGIGSVVVFAGNDAHPHGHIQIKTGNGQWTSDFAQKNFTPWRDQTNVPGHTVYEIK